MSILDRERAHAAETLRLYTKAAEAAHRGIILTEKLISDMYLTDAEREAWKEAYLWAVDEKGWDV